MVIQMCRSFAFIVLSIALFVACGGTERADTPRIVVSPTSLVFNSVALGGEDILDLLVENRGAGTLRVSSIRVSTNTDHVSLIGDVNSLTLEPGERTFVGVAYHPTQPIDTSGDVIFVTNDPQSPELRVEIDTPTPTPRPNISPAILDFGVVGVNTEGTIDVSLRNIGFAPLIVCRGLVTGSPEITSDLDEMLDAAKQEGSEFAVVDLSEVDTGAGVQALEFQLFYLPSAPGDDTASLVIEYDTIGDVQNACQDGNITTVTYEIDGTSGTSLLGREPCPIDFSERAIDVTHTEVVTLSNLGELNLDIFDVRLDTARSAPSFTVDVNNVPATLAPDEAIAFAVKYRPTTLNAEAGVVLIEHSDERGERVTAECRLAGVGVENDCAIAVPTGSILEDPLNQRGATIDWALPLQTLILDGTASYDPAGEAIVDYIWEVVEAPESAINGIRPFTGDPSNPALAQYSLPIAGRYKVCLSVVDSSGLQCDAACVDVLALPAEAIAVELTWDNPADPDQSDAEGSDVDLHFVKMTSAWFDPVYDTYYGNQAPSWSPEHPSLDNDDTDGVGPETIQMDDPESCQWYAVGVHYFRETYGTVWPSVKIYLQGNLVDHSLNQPLLAADYFWDVARIHWPSGTIVRVNEVLIGFNSRTSGGVAPPVTDEMRALGLCGTPP